MIFGTRGDLTAYARRIKLMCKGGDKLTEPEALALAQVATVTGLNPFTGEVWYIPGSGPMIGIAGARRIDQESAKDHGGYSTPDTQPCPPEEAGATEAEMKDVAAAFKCEITDSTAVLEYQKMFSATLASLRESGVTDPVPVAREICGPRPKWTGYGYSLKSERSRMSKTQLARKRAEADALKRKIVLPFGAQVAETDASPDYVEATAQDVTPKRTEAQNMAELGYEEAQFEADFPPVPAKEEAPAVQMYKYNDKMIMDVFKRVLGYDNKDAMQTIYELHSSKRIGNTLTIEEAEESARKLIEKK
jgi:hypothetical protein